jgi:hypothetical protein
MGTTERGYVAIPPAARVDPPGGPSTQVRLYSVTRPGAKHPNRNRRIPGPTPDSLVKTAVTCLHHHHMRQLHGTNCYFCWLQKRPISSVVIWLNRPLSVGLWCGPKLCARRAAHGGRPTSTRQPSARSANLTAVVMVNRPPNRQTGAPTSHLRKWRRMLLVGWGFPTIFPPPVFAGQSTILGEGNGWEFRTHTA